MMGGANSWTHNLNKAEAFYRTIILYIQESIQEEIEAAAKYRKRAVEARAAGFIAAAARWEDVANDEDDHKREFEEQLNLLMPQPRPIDYTSPGDSAYTSIRELSSLRQSSSLKRRFPQSNTDWEDLGYDIEARLTNQPDKNDVRVKVAIATFNADGDSDAAKRWLITKAGSLGIE